MYDISFLDLLWLSIPLLIVYFIYSRYNDDAKTIPLALSRMLLQLILIGYVLTYIFETKNFYIIIFVLSFMLVVASIISLRPLEEKRGELYVKSFLSIFVGGVSTLSLVILGVLHLELWYEPRFLIPLAGMVFSNSMNSVSIAAERFNMEFTRDNDYLRARSVAYKASLIPNINMFFAVGLVSIPGMMTGQILGGVDPIIAVKYQIMVMSMMLSSNGISTAIYLKLMQK